MEQYIAPTYETNSFVEAFRNFPRFGHGDDISKLFSSSNAMRSDYLVGALVLAIIFLSFFTIWMMVVTLFMCLGPGRVGFLSGFAFKEPEHSSTSNEKLDDFRLPRRIRTLFILSCLVVIAVTVNAYILSLHEISQNTHDAIAVVEELQQIGDDGETLANILRVDGQKSMNLAVTVADSLNPEKFCANDSLDDEISGNRSAVVDHLLILGEYFTDEEISTMEKDVFAEIKIKSEETSSLISSYGVKGWQAMLYLVSFTAIPALMLLGTLLTWIGKPIGSLNGLLTWFFLPCFIFFVTLSWCIVALFGSTAVMISDFCSGNQSATGPNGSLLSILEETYPGKELFFEASTYWIDGCKSQFPFSFFTNYTKSVDEALVSINAFVSVMEEFGLENLKATCGGKDFSYIIDYMDDISTNYQKLGMTSSSIVDLVVCEKINPLYVDLAHDTTCTEIPPLLVLTLSLMLVSSFFGMIMVTFRPSWLDVIRADHLNDYEFPIGSPGSYEESSITSNQEEKGAPPGLRSNKGSPARSHRSNQSNYSSPSSLEKMSVAVDDDSLKIIPPSPGKDSAFKVY